VRSRVFLHQVGEINIPRSIDVTGALLLYYEYIQFSHSILAS